MIDLHTHILPGVDDGALDMREALEMARMAADSGVKRLVVTPHSNQERRYENYCSEKLNMAYDTFKKAVRQEGLNLEINPGMEIFAGEDMAEKIRQQLLIGLNGGDTYLIEFPFNADPFLICDHLEEILEMGKRPLIAHPERYFCVQEYPSHVCQWLYMGCLTQVNKGSVLGKFGRRVAAATEVLLANELVTCIASDAHSPFMRTTHMSEVRDYIENRFGEAATYRLFSENPRRILENELIPFHGRDIR